MISIIHLCLPVLLFAGIVVSGEDNCELVLTNATTFDVPDNLTVGSRIATLPYDVEEGEIVVSGCSSSIIVNGSAVILNIYLSNCDIQSIFCRASCKSTNFGNDWVFVIRRVLQLPLIFKNKIVNISEALPVSETVYNFDDPGKGAEKQDCFDYKQPITYDLLTNGSGTFGLATGGKLTLLKPVDYEQETTYVLGVLATRFIENRTATANLTINIEDVDDMDPEFDHQTYRLIVPEENSTLLNTWIETSPKIYAYDRDTGSGRQNVLYRFENDTRVKDYFALNETTGLIELKEVLDRENESLKFGPLIIKAVQENTELRSATATLYIDIQDVNDNEPEFNPSVYTVRIDEHSSAGTYVTTVSATDKDEGVNAIVVYKLSTYGNIFDINNMTGVIRVRDSKLLDREANYTANGQLNIRVEAIDYSSGKSGDNATVEITLEDINDHNPMFTAPSYTFTIANRSVGSFVGQVSASDPDAGSNGNVTYSTSSSNVNISSSNGSLYLTSLFLSNNKFMVQACDQPDYGSPRCSQASVSVVSSDNTTIESSQHGDVMENVPISTAVMTISAHSDSSVKFMIDSDVTAFSVGESSGIIITQEHLDRETKSNYSFHVALLTGDAMVLANISVTIDVLDANDNAPEFTQSEYVFPLPSPTDGSVGRVKASDIDLGNNSVIIYTLHVSIDSYYFQIDSNTGQIHLKHKLPVAQDPFQLTVMATDHGEPALSSNTQVYITSTTVENNKVKIKTPMSSVELKKDKKRLDKRLGICYERAMKAENSMTSVLRMIFDIGGILNLTVSTSTNDGDSDLLVSASYNNGTAVTGHELQRQVLRHMTQIKALFSHQSNSQSLTSDKISAAEIALIVIAATLFFGTIIAVAILFRKWDKQKRYMQLHEHMKRRSSLYESQELKMKIEDETSDYNGSLNTQEEDTNNASSPEVVRGNTVTTFVNGAYDMDKTEIKATPEQAEGEKEPGMIPARSAEAINEAIASLDNLTKELNAEDGNLGNGESHDHVLYEFVKPDYDDHYENEVIDQGRGNFNEDFDLSSPNENEYSAPEELAPDVAGQGMTENNYENVGSPNKAADVDGKEKDESDDDEPLPDYEVKGVRFSAQVLDTVENKFEPLKTEKTEKMEPIGGDTRDVPEGLVIDDKDDDYIDDHVGDETDRVDEEIRSPLPTIRSDENIVNTEDSGTFHFGVEDEEESTQF